jgi:hypothetical protein
MTNRASHSVKGPVGGVLSIVDGPKYDPSGQLLVRANAKSRTSPWFFCDTGVGRFDIVGVAEVGTCHLASDDIGALREVAVTDDYRPGDPVSPLAFMRLQIWDLVTLESWADFPVADLQEEKWSGKGVSSALWGTDEYDITQEWSLALFLTGYVGLKAGLNRLVSPMRFAVALFGIQGEQMLDIRFVSQNNREVDALTMSRFSEETGIVIEEIGVDKVALNIIC